MKKQVKTRQQLEREGYMFGTIYDLAFKEVKGGYEVYANNYTDTDCYTRQGIRDKSALIKISEAVENW